MADKPEVFHLTVAGRRLPLIVTPATIWTVERLTDKSVVVLFRDAAAGSIKFSEIVAVIWSGVAVATPVGEPVPEMVEIADLLLRDGAWRAPVIEALSEFFKRATAYSEDRDQAAPAEVAAAPSPDGGAEPKQKPQPKPTALPPVTGGPTVH